MPRDIFNLKSRPGPKRTSSKTRKNEPGTVGTTDRSRNIGQSPLTSTPRVNKKQTGPGQAPTTDANNNKKQTAAAAAGGQPPPADGASPNTDPKKAKLTGRRGSIMNLTRLTQDGRKKPDHYKKLALEANSPSQISFQAITEFYEPSYEFYNAEDVYTYRGYKKLAKIDEGAFGVVYKAMRLGDRKQVALKEVDLSKRRSKRIEEMKRELFVLQKIDSPYIVKLIEHFVYGHTLVIIMEFCQGNNITNFLKDTPLEEEEVKFLFKQMVIGIKLMHRRGIAHRDVKLNNFLLDGTRKNVKVADFGLSVVPFKPETGLTICKTYCGTEPYMAPEIIRRNSKGFRQYNPYYADVWALGVCLYAMLTRTFPFKVNLSQRGLYKNQRERRWKVPKKLRDKCSEDLHDLIWHMLDPEPDRRITINGIMTHPWFNPDMVTLSKENLQQV